MGSKEWERANAHKKRRFRGRGAHGGMGAEVGLLIMGWGQLYAGRVIDVESWTSPAGLDRGKFKTELDGGRCKQDEHDGGKCVHRTGFGFR